MCFFDSLPPPRRLNGKIVHIWGAKSNPGLGKIFYCKFKRGNGPDGTLLKHVLEITDRDKKFFAEPGDSGTIVCLNGKHGKHVYAIGMFMGKLHIRNSSDEDNGTEHATGGTPENRTQDENTYLAFDIKYGLERLEQAH